MTIETRQAAGICELCGEQTALILFDLGPGPLIESDRLVCLCDLCNNHLAHNDLAPEDHWRALGTSIWSEFDSVKAAAKLVLQRLRALPWARDLEDQIYLPDDVLQWLLQREGSTSNDAAAPLTRDSNGTVLADGDSVTLIKDLDVKGAGFTAKRGTLVKQIKLTDDPKYIEGRINGSTIVLVSAYLKKA